jgi:hypothetical protein
VDYTAKQKIAIPFLLNNPLNDIAAEFNLEFDDKINNLDKLMDFIDVYPDTRMNISFTNGLDKKMAKTLARYSDNVYIRLQPSDIIACQVLAEDNIKFFFDRSVSANTYNSLEDFIALGVTDIYITDDLVYNLKVMRKWADEHHINLRLIVNRIPSTALSAGNDYKSPIFRPEDMDILENYFDCFEFAFEEYPDKAQVGIMYKIWFEDRKWFGELSEINSDIKFYFPNYSVIPFHRDFKMNCTRRCDSRYDNPCRKCSQLIEIATMLAEKDIIIKEDKN